MCTRRLNFASTVVASVLGTWLGSHRRAAGDGIGSGSGITRIECSCFRSSHRSPASTRVLRHEPLARAQVEFRKLVVHRHFASRSRVLMRVVGLALHCPQRTDSAKLAHVSWSGSSGGHHPWPDDRPTSFSTRRPISLCGTATGVNCIVALRAAVPGLSMPRVSRALATRSPPLASYLAQGAQREL